MKEAKNSTGVIVGRFQTPHLTDGHKYLINCVCEAHDNILILIGESPARLHIRNPLPGAAIKSMLEEYLKKKKIAFEIDFIPDHENDHYWSMKLDEIVMSKCSLPILYGSRDSFIKSYSGTIMTDSITPKDASISATKIRDEIKSNPNFNEPFFRQGIIYASHLKYPTAYPTVDILVYDRKRKRYLLGRKKGESLWRLIGGFVDPQDESLEKAAERELKEEVVGIKYYGCRYSGSCKINDWRYQGSSDGIITSVFVAEYQSGNLIAGDDIDELKWFDFDYKQRPLDRIKIDISHVMPAHQEILIKTLYNLKYLFL